MNKKTLDELLRLSVPQETFDVIKQLKASVDHNYEERRKLSNSACAMRELIQEMTKAAEQRGIDSIEFSRLWSQLVGASKVSTARDASRFL